jgi:hypothetical protein
MKLAEHPYIAGFHEPASSSVCLKSSK